MSRNAMRLMVMTAAAAFTMVGCASTSFVTTWTAPGATKVAPAGKKILALVLTNDQASRRSAEDALAAELTARGAQGVAAYTLFPNAQTPEEAAARKTLETAGVSGVVAVRPVSVDQEVTVTPSYYVEPSYRTFWGPGYWSYGWRGRYMPPQVRTDQVVTIETLVYALPSDSVVWAGRSRTLNPTRVDATIKELITAVVADMTKKGLL